ncbi:hypothetical protein CAPTEDRAFT_180902 [Capitella teleta]|uniref:Major facilitator superfamily associated domain-containing protein n=1 Tax=Capitella teleta TaxID=283909 RepID=R7T5J7_CAPTE|nr:hypothetical protein CAPTEDRAFT_180902 [Capitella teleta]|eukprot:ELT88520.1 hypothetical protein CAPTEDRAFT_180902 [Capitella teleta]
MEGYGYGDDKVGETFGASALNRQGSTASSTASAPPLRKPFNVFGPKGYLESKFSNLNYDLLISKTFYFFFFAAFGSLFPLIAVYFKQLGMNPVQTGVLIGFRPFVEFLTGPFWGNIAEKWRRFKEILLFALFCWVAFTLALAFIGPPADSCLIHNGTHIIVSPPWTMHDRTKRSTMIEPLDFNTKKPSKNKTEPYRIRYLPHPSIDAYGKSPLPLNHKDIANLEEINDNGLVSPPLSAVVYKQRDINEVFFILLVLMVIGEFVSSPAIALADAATLGYLGEDTQSYGKHRMFGSVGWAVAMFIVGIALDYSNIFPNHPCGNEQLVDRNYTVCFAVFSVLMCCAFLTATQFKFDTDGQNVIPLSEVMKNKIQQKIGGGGNPRDSAELEKRLHISLQNQGGSMITDTTTPTNGEQPNTFIPRGKPGQVGTLPQWMTVMKLLGTAQHMSSIFVLWYMGFGVGLVFAFLFWHLQDLRGTPTLFGFASVINHVSEIIAFFYAKKMIDRLGHVKVMYAGLVGNVFRFMYISWLRNPWWVLPFEFLQGLTHAAMWANGCSYVSRSIPSHLRPTAQGILSAIHHGLGRGCGAIIGGAFVHSFGFEATFRGYGVATLVVLGGYISLNYFYLGKYAPDLPAPAEGEQAEESSHLAPCGVPMSSMSHSLSQSKLGDQSKPGIFTHFY